MSAGAPPVAVPSRLQRPARARRAELAPGARAGVRLASFAALSLYGVDRWSRLLNSPPTARLLGLVALAVAIAGGVPLVRRLGSPPAAVAAFALCLLALPISGLPWQDLVHLRLALGARHVGDGLAGLPSAILPYAGPGRWVPSVIVLGAGVLLLDAAVVLAFAPAAFGDLRRGGAALPLVALAVVPSTLVRPELPYLQGALLFALLAGFMWGERLHRQSAPSALVVCAVAGLGAAALAPRLDAHHALVDYRAWAGGAGHTHVDSFAWNQTYGPLHWPRRGRVVLTVQARTRDYWKAENLDVFDGTAWVAGTVGSAPLPAPDRSAVRAWSQVIKVHVGAMRTSDVVAAGFAEEPLGLSGDVAGVSSGTWTALRPLGPGASYVVDTYSPHPTATQLRTAGHRYPRYLLDDYRSIRLPQAGTLPAADPELIFPSFSAGGHRSLLQVSGGSLDAPNPTLAIARSPYRGVYRLARRLAGGVRTPYSLAVEIKRYLDAHYRYNESPPVRSFPLAAFLLRDKIGYCQQFSGAMALLLRMDGVPARVAEGFTPGVRQGRTRAFTVTDVDAHAWVEAWFPHYGWVRFDPTPTAAPALGGQAALPIDKSQLFGQDGAVGAPRRDPQSATTALGARPGAGGGGVSAWLVLAIGFGLGLAGGAGSLLRRGPRDLEGRLAELERALLRTGRPLRTAVTLAELEQRFHATPEAAAYIAALRLARYRPAGGPDTPPPGARRALRRELAAGLGLRGRLRALWALPPRR